MGGMMHRTYMKAFLFINILTKKIIIFIYLYLLTPPRGDIEGGAITGTTNGPSFFSFLIPSELMKDICITDINNRSCFNFNNENKDFIFLI